MQRKYVKAYGLINSFDSLCTRAGKRIARVSEFRNYVRLSDTLIGWQPLIEWHMYTSIWQFDMKNRAKEKIN